MGWDHNFRQLAPDKREALQPRNYSLGVPARSCNSRNILSIRRRNFGPEKPRWKDSNYLIISRLRGTLRNIHQPVADSVHHQFSGLVDTQRIHNVGAMHGDGIGAEVELAGDFLVRQTTDDQLQYLQLTHR